MATIFKTHSVARSQKIDLNAIDRIFSTTELGQCPWDTLRETAYESNRAGSNFESEPIEGGISIENWIGLWNKYFHKDPKVAFRDLVYIGFCGTLADAIHPVRARPRDIFGVPSSRKTFNCLVVGSSGSGKSTFMDAVIMAQNSNEERK